MNERGHRDMNLAPGWKRVRVEDGMGSFYVICPESVETEQAGIHAVVFEFLDELCELTDLFVYAHGQVFGCALNGARLSSYSDAHNCLLLLGESSPFTVLS